MLNEIRMSFEDVLQMRVQRGDVTALCDDELALLRTLRPRGLRRPRKRGGGAGCCDLEHVTSSHLCHGGLLVR
jgi:hypothetical protein